MKTIKAGFMYIEILLALAIVMFIVFKVVNLYFKQSPLSKEDQRVISVQGIDTASPRSIVDSTRNKLQDIQSQHIDELDKIK